jgi:uncharacterized protein (DUF2236 family)
MSLTASAPSRGLRRRPLSASIAGDDFDPTPMIDGVAAYLGGNANVLMQLGRPEVAYGVLESTVESGKVTVHPLKRQRTTLTYLSVALLGTPADRLRYRKAVDESHRAVRSSDTSPVRYNAFDPELQLWVAACLYQGFVDTWTALHGPIPHDVHDALYRHCARLGTTLQMREDMWPADRTAFAEYWRDGVSKVRYDERTREYLMGLVDLSYLPAAARRPLRRFTRLSTGGFLHPEFRAALDYTWTTHDQLDFEQMVRRIAAVNDRLPGPIRRVPFNLFLLDTRRRARRGRPLV